MSNKMQAVIMHGPGDYRLEEVDVPRADAGEIVVEILACGICAGDVKCYKGAPMFWGDADRRGYAQPPAIGGHEFIGRVVELGEGAGHKFGIEIGDLAIAEQIVPCGKCRFCRSGKYWQCAAHDIFGFKSHLPGGMAQYMKFPSNAIVHKVPDAIDPVLAATIEPLACSIHAVDRGEINPGDTVVVAGCGTLGLGMIGAAKLKSPGLLIAIDLRDHRLDVAERMGADLTLNPRRTDVVKEVLELTDGYGCDVYIEATGHPSGVKQGLLMIRRLGTFVEFSVFSEETSVDWTIIGDGKELNIHGSHLGPNTYPIAIEYLASGKIDMSEVVTHKIPLVEFEKGFNLVAEEEGIKVVLIP